MNIVVVKSVARRGSKQQPTMANHCQQQPTLPFLSSGHGHQLIRVQGSRGAALGFGEPACDYLRSVVVGLWGNDLQPILQCDEVHLCPWTQVIAFPQRLRDGHLAVGSDRHGLKILADRDGSSETLWQPVTALSRLQRLEGPGGAASRGSKQLPTMENHR